MNVEQITNRLDMINTLVPNEKLIVGGQPSKNDLAVLKDLGIKHVVNLRPESEEISYDEPCLVKELGMEYHLIPVTDIDSYSKSAAQAYLAIVELGQPILVHCASGNRVGALIALADYWLNGVGNSEALAHGLQAGLTKLETDVRQVLQC